MAAARTIALKSGGAIPCLGLGTFLATKPGEVGAAVKAAITCGYRLIDCAAGYGNQAEIGVALQEVFAEGICKREDLFIVSKLFQTHHGEPPPSPLPSFRLPSAEFCQRLPSRSPLLSVTHPLPTRRGRLQSGRVMTPAAMRPSTRPSPTSSSITSISFSSTGRSHSARRSWSVLHRNQAILQ